MGTGESTAHIEHGTSRLSPAAAAARAADLRVPARGTFWKDALRRRMLAAADLAAVLLAAAAVGLVEGGASAFWIAASAPLWVLVAKLRGLYDRDHVRLRHLTLDESSSLFHWALLCGAATGLLLVALPGELVTITGALVMGVTVYGGSFLLRAAARALWRRVVPAERALLVGSGAIARSLARRLALESGHHVELVRQVDLEPESADGGGAPTTLDDWAALVRSERVERVVLALSDLDEATLARVLSDCRALGVKLSVAPPLRAMLGTAVVLNHLAELPLIEFRTWDVSRSTMMLKRSMDVLGAGLALVLAGPLLLLLGLAVRLDSPGPALFRQRRVGLGGAPFEMLKFRTMCDGADAMVDDVVSVDALADPVFKLRADPRVTRVGRILRRTSLDELPQLINVLRGEMSLVGPRPEEEWLVARYDEADRFRLEMRPGMTGPMQVHGRAELSFQERISVEREYVENYSLRKDVKILFQTLAAVVSGRGAY